MASQARVVNLDSLVYLGLRVSKELRARVERQELVEFQDSQVRRE